MNRFLPWENSGSKAPRRGVKTLTSIELCAGAGGQAIGLEQAGFRHLALVENDPHAVQTLRLNRPEWNVVEGDITKWSAKDYRGVDLLAAGLPCPPFSKAGKQLGENDERNLFPTAIRIVGEARPKAVMIENVRGILDAVFDDFRTKFQKQIESLGYVARWRLYNACDLGVPQLRPRVVFVALRREYASQFSWPSPSLSNPPTVGEVLHELMASRGWKHAGKWAKNADEIAPTLVGGSKKHGGPDLGPTRARQAWAKLGVDGLGLADEPPLPAFVGMPRLTVPMAALIQGFPKDWRFSGRKTAAYRQVGNAFPPPVARAVASELYRAISLEIDSSVAA